MRKSQNFLLNYFEIHRNKKSFKTCMTLKQVFQNEFQFFYFQFSVKSLNFFLFSLKTSLLLFLEISFNFLYFLIFSFLKTVENFVESKSLD